MGLSWKILILFIFLLIKKYTKVTPLSPVGEAAQGVNPLDPLF